MGRPAIHAFYMISVAHILQLTGSEDIMEGDAYLGTWLISFFILIANHLFPYLNVMNAIK